MEDRLSYNIAGAALIAVGVLLASNPEWVSNKPVPADTCRAVERRVWWGLFIGAGVLVIGLHQLRPWLATYVGVSAAMTFGLLVARLIGIALDGGVAKQWFWVAVEVVILAGLLWWYEKVRA
jgi:hypothetical protein